MCVFVGMDEGLICSSTFHYHLISIDTAEPSSSYSFLTIIVILFHKHDPPLLVHPDPSSCLCSNVNTPITFLWILWQLKPKVKNVFTWKRLLEYECIRKQGQLEPFLNGDAWHSKIGCYLTNIISVLFSAKYTCCPIIWQWRIANAGEK